MIIPFDSRFWNDGFSCSEQIRREIQNNSFLFLWLCNTSNIQNKTKQTIGLAKLNWRTVHALGFTLIACLWLHCHTKSDGFTNTSGLFPPLHKYSFPFWFFFGHCALVNNIFSFEKCSFGLNWFHNRVFIFVFRVHLKNLRSQFQSAWMSVWFLRFVIVFLFYHLVYFDRKSSHNTHTQK